MFLADLLFAFVIGLFLVTLFDLIFRNRGPWGSFWIFLLVVFLAAWAGGAWLQPFGPLFMGVSWMPFLIVGIVVTLLLAAASPPPRPRTRREAMIQAEAETAAAVAFSVFFWILLLGFIVLIIFAYL